jgi:histidyl-tRNA synthetase
MSFTRVMKKTPPAVDAAEKPVAKAAAKPAKSPASGTRDIITQASPLWDVILKSLHKVGRNYGFLRVEVPILEEADLFQNYYKTQGRLPAVTLDVSGKIMAARPTLLPSVLRSYVQYKVAEANPLSKWSYSGNVISVDPAGKLVSDYEFGFEVLGTFTHLTEAQAIGAAWQFTQSLGLVEATLEINTLGGTECRSVYEDVLRDYLRSQKFELCENCHELTDKTPLAVFRCDNMGCHVVLAEAPTILDYLDDPSQKHFTSILEALDEMQIPYQLNPLYTGSPYACRTSVAIKYKHGNRSFTIGEASYHDNIIKQLTGRTVTGFGFAGSLGVLEQILALSETPLEPEAASEVFLVPLGELASKRSLRLFQDLIAADIRVYDNFGTVGVKNQLKQAEELKSPIALIMGQKEAMDEMVILRDVKSGMQEVFSYDKIVEEVKKRLGR